MVDLRGTESGRPLILVVEDDSDLLGLLEVMLEEEYRVATAADGREGLEKAQALLPDLILSDFMMPVMSGEDMLRELRKRRELDHVPIIILTANPDEHVRNELLRAGAQDYLVKPFPNDRLLTCVAHHLSSPAAEKASPETRSAEGSLGLMDAPLRPS